MSILSTIVAQLLNLLVLTWDFLLFLLNFVLPSHAPGHVVPARAPGHNLSWPAYTPPSATDSRSACPMLNALANHGILPHSGRNISFKQMNASVRSSYNFAPSFCFFVPKFAADFLKRSYWSGTFDLADLSLHNAIEHDASLTRHDAAHSPDQAAPDLKLVAQLLSEATGSMPDGSPRLTIPDLSRALSKRRVASRLANKEYSSSLFHDVFGCANSSTMLTIFGGSVPDLTTMLTEERFPDNWEPRVTAHYGLTMAKFNFTVLPVMRGVNEKGVAKLEKGQVEL